MTVMMTEETFDPWLEIHNYQKTLNAEGKFGACTTFVSMMRDASEHSAASVAQAISDVDEQSLQRIAYQTTLKWNILGSLIIYRHTHIKPGEPTLLVAVWAAHQNAAFEACHFLLDHLKNLTPPAKNGTQEPIEQYA